MSPRRFRVTLLFALSLLAAGPVFAQSKAAAKPAAATGDTLVWRGDHATGRALMEDLSKEYAKQKKGKISLQPFSTLSGLDAVANGSADIGGSARAKYARRAEESALNFIPVALDGAVLITHPKNPVGNLTLKQIHDIYYGRIKNWNELGGPDKPINLYAIASPLDGVEYSLRELVFRNGDQRVAAPRLYINTVKLEEGIAIDPAGLGLSTMAVAHANKGLKMMSVEGVAPTTATVGNGTYPLYITLYLAERVDSPKQEAVARFISFLDTPAAKGILRRHQLTPYSEAGDVLAENERRMAYIDTQVGRDATAVARAIAAGTPVSAPRATLEAHARVAPTAESTQTARENLARAEAKKAEQAQAASAAPAAPVAKPAPVAKAAPKPAAAKPAEKKVAAAPKKAQPKPAAKPVAKATPAPAKPAEKKAPSFDNVSSGAQGGR